MWVYKKILKSNTLDFPNIIINNDYLILKELYICVIRNILTNNDEQIFKEFLNNLHNVCDLLLCINSETSSG